MSVTGDRLRSLREKEKLTQEELAFKIGIKRDRYAKYETGENPVPANILVRLADFLVTTTDYLLGRTDDPAPSRSTQNIFPSQNSEELTKEKAKEVLMKDMSKSNRMIFKILLESNGNDEHLATLE